MAAGAVLVVLAIVASGCAFVTRVNVPTPPSQGVSPSAAPAMSADGKYVAFVSASEGFSVSDDNALDDVFLKDRETGVIERVSRCGNVGVCGDDANGGSRAPAVSNTGRYVVFESDATNHLTGDTNGATDIFLRDRQTGTLQRVSVTDAEAQANGASTAPRISDDGRYVAFVSSASNLVTGDTNSADDVFVRDRTAGTTTRVSISTGGVQGNGFSTNPDVSADGRFVTFLSEATNLVGADTNFFPDVFVRDRQTNTTTRVSVSTAGVQGDGTTGDPTISDNGAVVAFTSGSGNLVAGDGNFDFDIFVRVLATNTTSRVSLSSGGAQGDGRSEASALSSDGRYVSFTSISANLVAGDTNAVADTFRRDRQTGTTVRTSVADDETQANDAVPNQPASAISGNGALIAFAGIATNLVAGDSNTVADVFVRDVPGATTVRASVNAEPHTAPSGILGPTPTPVVSSTGRYVAFASDADNLVANDTNAATDIFVRDLQAGTVQRVSVAGAASQVNSDSFSPAISADGRFVTFVSAAINLVAGDTNAVNDIFVRDRTLGTTIRASLTAGGLQSTAASFDPDISDNGRYVVFYSGATNLVVGDTNAADDVFLRDTVSATTTRQSVTSGSVQANGASQLPSISDNGAVVTFTSFATNLGTGTDANAAADTFFRDTTTGTTDRVSNITGSANAGNALSYNLGTDASGRYALFLSNASNLVAGDTNTTTDTFVRDRVTGVTERVSVATGGAQISDGAAGSISSNGRWVAFATTAGLAPQDTNATSDVYLRDRTGNRTTLASSDLFLGAGGVSSGLDAPSLSGNGRYVAFSTFATFVAGDSTGTCCVADAYVRHAPVPTVTGISPTTRARGTTGTVTITGTNFFADATVQLSGDFTVNSFTVVNETTITASVTVKPTAALGPVHTVLVGLNGAFPGLTGSLGQCANCLTVTT